MDQQFLAKWKSQVKKGTLTLVVLSILRERECYGFELIVEIRERVSIEIAEGTLYPLLNRLRKEALVSSRWMEQSSGIPRKYYKLLPEGTAMLLQMTAFWRELDGSIKKLS
ncbi:PadR family transcriptional regulator [Lewinella sp. IMCC34191]|uniref:PadR family transcriptional regulator n=1 Tax=Lewinella sp. IMCC34191 TaxID=2259172 RepID=UPI000E27BFBC|nr:PadR family transcriptional regulator [Lewinella sp. IMCC34191]